MDLKRRLFRLSIFINIVIMAFSVYYVKVQDSEWWGYTFIGVFMWTVGLVSVVPGKRVSKWYRVNNSLIYPVVTLVPFAIFLHSSSSMNFVVKTVVILAPIGLMVYYIQKRLNKTILLVYYSGLLVLAGILCWGYPLVQLTYIPFVVYCAMNLLQEVKDE